MRTLLVSLGLLLAIPAHADAPVLKGTYGWDYMKPKASKCTKVTATLATKMKKYDCTVPDKGSTASGKDAVADCKNKKGDDGYLFFDKLADCNKERETQLANAE